LLLKTLYLVNCDKRNMLSNLISRSEMAYLFTAGEAHKVLLFQKVRGLINSMDNDEDSWDEESSGKVRKGQTRPAARWADLWGPLKRFQNILPCSKTSLFLSFMLVSTNKTSISSRCDPFKIFESKVARESKRLLSFWFVCYRKCEPPTQVLMIVFYQINLPPPFCITFSLMSKFPKCW